MGKGTDSKDVMEGEIIKLGVAVEKEEEVNTQAYDLNSLMNNDTILFFKKEEHILRKDHCLSI